MLSISSFENQIRSPLSKKSEKLVNFLSFLLSFILGLIDFFKSVRRIFSIFPSLVKVNNLLSSTEIKIAGLKFLNSACPQKFHGFTKRILGFKLDSKLSK